MHTVVFQLTLFELLETKNQLKELLALNANCWQFPLVRTKRFRNRSFGYSTPAAWNFLRKDLHDSSIYLLSFKSMPKTHLFRS